VKLLVSREPIIKNFFLLRFHHDVKVGAEGKMLRKHQINYLGREIYII
jgi:hypothetical protein